MTDAECAETLAEFRTLTLGPDLSAALDHAIGVMQRRNITFELARDQVQAFAGFEAAGRQAWIPPQPTAEERIKAYGGIPMDSRAIDLAAA